MAFDDLRDQVEVSDPRAVELGRLPYPGHEQAPLLWKAIERARRERITLDEAAEKTSRVTRENNPPLFTEADDSLMGLLEIGDDEYHERVDELMEAAKGIMAPES